MTRNDQPGEKRAETPRDAQALRQQMRRDREAYEDTIQMLEAENVELTNKYIEQIRVSNELRAKLRQTEQIYEGGLLRSFDSTGRAERDAGQNAGYGEQLARDQLHEAELAELRQLIREQQKTIQRQTAEHQRLTREISKLNVLLHERHRSEQLRRVDEILSFQ